MKAQKPPPNGMSLAYLIRDKLLAVWNGTEYISKGFFTLSENTDKLDDSNRVLSWDAACVLKDPPLCVLAPEGMSYDPAAHFTMCNSRWYRWRVFIGVDEAKNDPHETTTAVYARDGDHPSVLVRVWSREETKTCNHSAIPKKAGSCPGCGVFQHTTWGNKGYTPTRPDLVNWGNHKPLVLPEKGTFHGSKTGGSCVPIKTEDGWLEIYHGSDETDRYSLAAVLLDLNDPTKVIARGKVPIMEPRADYEINGFYGNVVFACGAIVEDDGRMIIYYGASDESTAGAVTTINKIMETFK